MCTEITCAGLSKLYRTIEGETLSCFKQTERISARNDTIK